MTTGPVWCVQQSLHCDNWSSVVFNSLYCDNWSGVVCSTESVLQQLVRCGVFNRVCTVTTGPVWCVQQSLYCDNWSGVVCSTESVL